MFTTFEPAVSATIVFLKCLKVKVNRATVNSTLQNHPDWPSLLCISDALHTWNIPNAAGKLNSTAIEQIPLPFLAYTKNREYPLIIVTGAEAGVLTYHDNGNYTKQKQAGYDDFFKIWDGTYLFAEPTENSGEKDYLNQKNKQVKTKIGWIVLLITLFSFLAIALYHSANKSIGQSYGSATYFRFFILLAGVFISTLLLWYEIDKNNPALKKVCTGITKGNCDAILSSNHAKLFTWLSWSEVGFFYFTGSLLTLVFTGSYLPLVNILLSWISILALPYTIFSVYYQWKVARQWCVLCLAIQLLLITGAAQSIFFYGLLPLPNATLSFYPFFLLVFAIPAIVWYIIKPFLLKLQKAKTQDREYLRLKFNTGVFEALLKKQKQITHPANGLGINLGNPAAKHELIKVCNPYCGPCSLAHLEIERIIEENKNVKAKIIFNANNDEKDIRVKPVQHLLAIAAENDSNKIARALDDWYLAEKKEYEAFAALYPVNGELKRQGSKIEEMYEWCKAMDIHFTPTFFINGYQMPDVYNLKDINYFLLE